MQIPSAGFDLSTPCVSCGAEKQHTVAAHFGVGNRCIIEGCGCGGFEADQSAATK